MSMDTRIARGTVLEANEIAFAYPGSGQTLEKVSAQILPGSFLAVLGVNGCGKTTLLSCLDDIIRPQRGTVMLAGEDIASYTREERARKIALVAQHSHAHGVTVYDALLLGRKPHIKAAPSEEDFTIVDRVIDELGLGPLALRYLDELSAASTRRSSSDARSCRKPMSCCSTSRQTTSTWQIRSRSCTLSETPPTSTTSHARPSCMT